ncbi:MAG: dephospho-CoA kinase [Thermotogae bacterium]|nr:dephospho-CoA kinase [Thermotogota bacterium]
MKVLGITGYAGSGKSELAKHLASRGAELINVDRIGHQVLELLKSDLQCAFGHDIINEDGSINRIRLAELVFNDLSKLETLNAMTHPLIREITRDKLQESKSKIVVIDAALLFKIGLDEFCDVIICVKAPEVLCIERLKAKGKRESIAHAILNAQKGEIYTRCDKVVENTGTVEDLEREADRLWNFYTHQGGVER